MMYHVDQPKPVRSRLLSGPLVDIYVGASKRHWCLHRNLLCHHSIYFKDHAVGEDKQKAATVELLDDDPRAFELLVKWLYQGRIDDVSNMPIEKKWDYADACQKLYVLCDKLILPQLKNFAIDQFRKGCFQAGLVPGPEEMKAIYDTTPPLSPFRKLASKIAARQIMAPDSQDDAGIYKPCFEENPDFAIDVINAIRQGAGGILLGDPTEGGGCTYHEHQNGERCNVE